MAGKRKPAPCGSRMGWWIGDVLKKEREAAGVKRDALAQTIRVNDQTLKRVEAGNMGRDIDQIVGGYAYILAVDDPRDLWKQAIGAYAKHGTPPKFTLEDSPAAAFAEALRAAARQQRQAVDRGRQGKHGANRKPANG